MMRITPTGMKGLLILVNVLTLSSAFVAGGFHPRTQPSTFGISSTIRRSSAVEEKESPSSSSEDNKETTKSNSSSDTIILADNEEFIRPELDRRKYRAIKLHNNLEVLLVSAPESDVEGASVHVQAGHMDDKEDRAGLAHFHEHMLFLGTEKYPLEDEYEGFLCRHGGSSNAWTDMEETNYYFSVTPHQADDDADEEDSPDITSTALSGSLDRFAQFFIAPKFDVNMVDRELRAIDSEYKNALTSDQWRQYSLLKSFANKDHPFSKFGCGNYNTLTNGGKIIDDTKAEGGSSPVDDLVWFWKTYYQTYNLKLCVVGRSSLDALQKTVEETFGGLAPSDGKPRHTSRTGNNKIFPLEHSMYNQVPAFGPEQLQKVRQVIPLKESRTLKIFFACPPLDDPTLKASRPYRVLSHLLGHESPGSLHEVLNDDGLLVDLTSGIGIDASDFSLFSLTIALTKKGMAEKDKVLDLVFQWIAKIKSTPHGVLEQYHDELRQISDMNFKYRENSDASDFCATASELMFTYEPKDLLVGSSHTGRYDPVVCDAFMERLTPQNAMIVEINSDLTTTNNEDITSSDWQTETWYGAQYKEHDISDETVQKWTSVENIDPRLKLPGLNKYIPSDFTLRCDDDVINGDKKEGEKQKYAKEPPQLLVERPGVRLWHKLDRTWRVPKTCIDVSMVTRNVYRSPRTMTCNRIFQKVLNNDLNSFVYDANVAGCSYRVGIYDTGYRLSVNGYSEKIQFLLDTLTSRMLSLIKQMKEGPEKHPALAEMFNKAKEGLLRETKNYRLDDPCEIANYNSRLLIEEDAWFLDDYINEMEGVYADKDPLTMQECARVAEECLLGRLKTEILCMGNINDEQAQGVLNVLDNHFLNASRPLPAGELPSFHSLKIPTREEAIGIIGPSVADKAIPLVCQDVAYSESEENNAIEIILQAGSGLELGWEGMALLYLVSHLSYNSVYNQLRTKEQLGYIVQSYVRKTNGFTWGLSVVVQSSVALPDVLEERCEAWLKLFRKELVEMGADDIAMEAAAVAAQLLERDTTLSQEVSQAWGAITMVETLGERMRDPPFNRLERIVQEIVTADATDDFDQEFDVAINDALPRITAEDLKSKLLAFFDKHFAAASPKRRAMSARIYNQKAKNEFEKNMNQPGVLSSYDDIRDFKQYLDSYSNAPYWMVDNKR